MRVIPGSVLAQLVNLEKVLGEEGELGLCLFAKLSRSLLNISVGKRGEEEPLLGRSGTDTSLLSGGTKLLGIFFPCHKVSLHPDLLYLR